MKIIDYRLSTINIVLPIEFYSKAIIMFVIRDELRKLLHKAVEDKFNLILTYERILTLVDSMVQLYEINNTTLKMTIGESKVIYKMVPRLTDYKIAIDDEVHAVF